MGVCEGSCCLHLGSCTVPAGTEADLAELNPCFALHPMLVGEVITCHPASATMTSLKNYLFRLLSDIINVSMMS